MLLGRHVAVELAFFGSGLFSEYTAKGRGSDVMRLGAKVTTLIEAKRP